MKLSEAKAVLEEAEFEYFEDIAMWQKKSENKSVTVYWGMESVYVETKTDASISDVDALRQAVAK